MRAGVTERGPIHLAGIGDLYTRADDPGQALAGLSADAPVLCFTHTPDLFPQLPPACALTVTGHSHGGQVRLPLLGRPAVPSRYGDRFAAGHMRDGKKRCSSALASAPACCRCASACRRKCRFCA